MNIVCKVAYIKKIPVYTPSVRGFYSLDSQFMIHKYFNDNGFFYINTPIITGTDAEGAGETFRVTTLPLGENNKDDQNDFFGKPTHLTVSGQLEAELAALALGKAYTFGPTFRAENSNTSKKLERRMNGIYNFVMKVHRVKALIVEDFDFHL